MKGQLRAGVCDQSHFIRFAFEHMKLVLSEKSSKKPLRTSLTANAFTYIQFVRSDSKLQRWSIWTLHNLLVSALYFTEYGLKLIYLHLTLCSLLPSPSPFHSGLLPWTPCRCPPADGDTSLTRPTALLHLLAGQTTRGSTKPEELNTPVFKLSLIQVERQLDLCGGGKTRWRSQVFGINVVNQTLLISCFLNNDRRTWSLSNDLSKYTKQPGALQNPDLPYFQSCCSERNKIKL